MKKLIYIFLFAVLTASSFTACTEEEVTPVAESGNAGGHPIKE